eukprot:4999826-Amphidinium_carterae.2
MGTSGKPNAVQARVLEREAASTAVRSGVEACRIFATRTNLTSLGRAKVHSGKSRTSGACHGLVTAT